MFGWIDGRMDRWIKEEGGRMYGWVRWMNKSVSGWMDGLIGVLVDARMQD